MPNNLVLPKGNPAPSGSRGRGSGTVGGAAAALTPAAALAVLSLGKLSRVAAAFLTFTYLDSPLPLPLYLFIVTLSAAVLLCALQRPWRGRRIGAKRAKKIALAGALTAAMLYVWSAGLRSAGPLRALLIDGAELPLLYVFAVASGRELAERRKSRGAFLMLAAYALLIYDASGHAPDIAELERTRIAQKAEASLGQFGRLTKVGVDHLRHHGIPAAPPPVDAGVAAAGNDPAAALGARRRLLAMFSRPRRRLLTASQPRVPPSGSMRDAFVEGTPLRAELGVLLVLAASVIMQASRPFTRRLAHELGGAKRHFALTVAASSAVLSPLAGLSYVSSSSGAFLSMAVLGGGDRVPMNAAHVLGFAAVGFLWLVLPYYIRAIVSTAVEQRTMLQAGVVVPFALAAVGSTVFGLAARAGGVSWILVAAFLFDAAGLSMMVAAGGSQRTALSELPLDSRTSVSSIGGPQIRPNRGE
jgi:hypothetical protein